MTDRDLPAGPDVECVLHKYHSPEVVNYDVHHVIPTYMGGPDVATNRIVVCPTSHRTLHVLIKLIADGAPLSPRDWGRTTWDYAHRAFA